MNDTLETLRKALAAANTSRAELRLIIREHWSRRDGRLNQTVIDLDNVVLAIERAIHQEKVERSRLGL